MHPFIIILLHNTSERQPKSSGPGAAVRCWFWLSILLPVSGMVHCGATCMEVFMISVFGSSVRAESDHLSPEELRSYLLPVWQEQQSCCANWSFQLSICIFSLMGLISHWGRQGQVCIPFYSPRLQVPELMLTWQEVRRTLPEASRRFYYLPRNRAQCAGGEGTQAPQLHIQRCPCNKQIILILYLFPRLTVRWGIKSVFLGLPPPLYVEWSLSPLWVTPIS